jgi:hypothetical protein
MNSRPFLVLTACLTVLVIALSFYAWQLRKNGTPESGVAPELPLVTPPGQGAPKQVALWVGYDDPGVLRTRTVSIPISSERQERAQEVLRALVAVYTAKDSPHQLPAGADVRNVFFVDPGLVVIDVNSELAAGNTSGVLAEELTIVSFVQTLSLNVEGVSRVKFLVDGKEASTLSGHSDLASAYDVSQVAILAKQLSSP